MRLYDDDGGLRTCFRIPLVVASLCGWIALLPAIAIAGLFFLSQASFGWQPSFEWYLGLELPVLVAAFAISTGLAAAGTLRALVGGAIVILGLLAVTALASAS